VLDQPDLRDDHLFDLSGVDRVARSMDPRLIPTPTS
jgi:hypothetical protein